MLTDTLCAALTAGGLGIAVVTAYRRRYLAATRIAAIALLPFGLALAGLVTLARRISTAVGDWAADLVFKPTVWAGFAVIACSAALYGVTRLFSGRRSRRGDARTASGDTRHAPAAAAGSAPAPALGAGRRRSHGSSDSGLTDFADVEEILKRRGI